jgi:hypothetical protein
MPDIAERLEQAAQSWEYPRRLLDEARAEIVYLRARVAAREERSERSANGTYCA